MDCLHQPARLLLTNVSVVAVEHSVATTGLGRRFGALSDVSFDVEFVSSISDSSCSDLALMSKEVGASSLISPTKRRSTKGHRGVTSLQIDEPPITRRMQSGTVLPFSASNSTLAPDITPRAEPCKELLSCSQSTRQIGRDNDKCDVFGRHSMDIYSKRERHGLGDAGLCKEDYINAFQSCKPKLRKDPKNPIKICSFRKHRRSVRPELIECAPSTCSKPHSSNRATTSRLPSSRRDSNDTNSQADESRQEHVILPSSRYCFQRL